MTPMNTIRFLWGATWRISGMIMIFAAVFDLIFTILLSGGLVSDMTALILASINTAHLTVAFGLDSGAALVDMKKTLTTKGKDDA